MDKVVAQEELAGSKDELAECDGVGGGQRAVVGKPLLERGRVEILEDVVARGSVLGRGGGGKIVCLERRGVPGLADEGGEDGVVRLGLERGEFQDE